MLSLFLPEKCVHCGSSSISSSSRSSESNVLSKYLCEACNRILLAQEAPSLLEISERLGRIAPNLSVNQCASKFTFYSESPIQSIVHSFKYSAMPALARACGRLISDTVPAGMDYLVPVPLHRTRLAERGYNQSEALAEGIASQLGLRVLRDIKRNRATPSQTTLSIPQRINNVRGAFELAALDSRIKDKNLLIVDDVMTTGSTLASVAETLLPAKPRSISILTLAIAEPSS